MSYHDIRAIFKHLYEGGNTVPDAEPVDASDSIDIADEVIGKLSDSGYEACAAGSTGKAPMSGDIDILVKGNKDTDMDKLIGWLGDAYGIGEDELSKSGGQLHWGYELGTRTVQVDMEIVPDLDMGRFYRYSPNIAAGESEWKGSYRTALLMQLAKTRPLDDKLYPTVMFDESDDVADKYIGTPKDYYNLSLMARGLYVRHRSYKGTKKPRVATPNVIDEKLISINPDEIARILLGPGATVDDCNTLESITDWILSDRYPYRDEETLSRIFYRMSYDDLIFKDGHDGDNQSLRRKLLEWFRKRMRDAGLEYTHPDDEDSLTE